MICRLKARPPWMACVCLRSGPRGCDEDGNAVVYDGRGNAYTYDANGVPQPAPKWNIEPLPPQDDGEIGDIWSRDRWGR